jgi:hypothetical protein
MLLWLERHLQVEHASSAAAVSFRDPGDESPNSGPYLVIATLLVAPS